MRHISLVLVGFGNVGQAFGRLLLRKQSYVEHNFDFSYKITGIATSRHGIAIDPTGINVEKALEIAASGGTLSALTHRSGSTTIAEFIQQCPGDVFFENTPVNHHTGEPALSYLKAALERNMTIITANKGPVVFGYRELTAIARSRHRRFLFESAVMDGAPIFSLFRGPLPAIEIKGFFGILNSCTNYILGCMESGDSLEEAIQKGQAIGITETDPSADIDGWDAAIKVAALSSVILDKPLTPEQVNPTGIRGLTKADLAEASQQGKRWKLVCRARLTEDGVETQVAPELVASDSPLYAINGTSSFIQFESDVLPGLGIVETNPGPETTAYGLLADLINAMRNQ
ncbi:MAG TPA: homoserine dehydrogenase [Longilinea sp.]|nr:homoserine dehydrogenase [Longilinea sp.]